MDAFKPIIIPSNVLGNTVHKITLIPLAMVTGRALFSPISIEQFAASAIKAYSVTQGAIERAVERASAAKGSDHI